MEWRRLDVSQLEVRCGGVIAAVEANLLTMQVIYGRISMYNMASMEYVGSNVKSPCNNRLNLSLWMDHEFESLVTELGFY